MPDKFAEAAEAGLVATAELVLGPVSLLRALITPWVPDNDKAFAEARLAELENDVLECFRRIEALGEQLRQQGQELDNLGVTHGSQLTKDLLAALHGARSKTKRDAIINAVAHQFDPRFGQQGIRTYLLQMATELSDAQIEALLLVASHPNVIFNAKHWRFDRPSTRKGQSGTGFEPIDLTEDEVTAVHLVLTEMLRSNPPLVETDGSGGSFKATRVGRTLARMIKLPGGEPTGP